MAKQAKVLKVEMIEVGIKELLKGDEITATVMEVAEEIARDARAKSGRDDFDAQLWKERKTRNVANVRFTHAHAVSIEAAHGHLGKAAKKDRGWR